MAATANMLSTVDPTILNQFIQTTLLSLLNSIRRTRGSASAKPGVGVKVVLRVGKGSGWVVLGSCSGDVVKDLGRCLGRGREKMGAGVWEGSEKLWAGTREGSRKCWYTLGRGLGNFGEERGKRWVGVGEG